MNLPVKTGLTILKNLPLEEVVKMIDWKMYLVTWDFRTNEARMSKEADELLRDSRILLDRVVKESLLSIDGAVRIEKARTVDYDDILLYDDKEAPIMVLPMLRRQIPRMGHCPSLADYIVSEDNEPSEPGLDDYMGFFAVTSSKNLEEALKLFPEDDLYSPLLLKSLADRLAEAGAEYIHSKVRREIWGYEKGRELSPDEMLKEAYQGIRPAPGYPCCPDHTGKQDIFDLLEAEKNLGISLTESYMMQPAASVCGYIFASEKAKYFPVGKIGEDQLESYALRKGMDQREIRRWLSVNLND
ncbi:vitamin B12 dependent-methionine synthase activation domain-containing protein [Spirochaeta isovalerica]|uniref:Cobalamin-dependent methionine synthase I n=1 Tax=Spirochaeta isovalerica TaxID=150 RepID=A0A841R840_9SPIO|nr:vitamin B12 dependent-methionine synthase activation domain-containing protein [Spirochaeta isovalerica]MBB6478642.1 cobalamin-dependent methionine synthase I [Spirochaeta isovalerica]